MLNFTIHNVKVLFLVISLICQLTTPKVQRRMSEGLAKDNPPAGAAEYVPPATQFKIQNSKFKIAY